MELHETFIITTSLTGRKIRSHPETGIFLYKSINWQKIEESEYLKKEPGFVIEPDVFLVVSCIDVSKYVYFCYAKVRILNKF